MKQVNYKIMLAISITGITLVALLIGVYLRLLRKTHIKHVAAFNEEKPAYQAIPNEETRAIITLIHMDDQDVKVLAAANNDKSVVLVMCNLYGDPLSVNYIMGKAITKVDCQLNTSNHSALVKIYYNE